MCSDERCLHVVLHHREREAGLRRTLCASENFQVLTGQCADHTTDDFPDSDHSLADDNNDRYCRIESGESDVFVPSQGLLKKSVTG